MPWLVDGSNVLGAMRVDRHSDDSKRGLVRLLASFARAKKTRVTCVFDGMEPPSFARHLGSVSVLFSDARSADELIAERARNGRGWSVVTSDRGLAARVARREVTIVAPQKLIREMELAASGEGEAGGDWEAYFSDPKNRLKF
ncbi:MAG TPA: NYN domain-containing protein [Thermoanaerobaculia bacterium]|nr:NYN domain-containing protein [Thermoanaerobaculia bacterium]